MTGRAASLQARLLVLVLGLSAAVWLVAAALTWRDARHEIDELLDSHLAQSAALLVARDAGAGEEAAAACAPVADRWYDSARCGLADPALHAAAMACVAAGRDALGHMAPPVSGATTDLCDHYVERYLGRRRTPGDDVLDAWHHGRPLVALPPEDDRWT